MAAADAALTGSVPNCQTSCAALFKVKPARSEKKPLEQIWADIICLRLYFEPHEKVVNLSITSEVPMFPPNEYEVSILQTMFI